MKQTFHWELENIIFSII